jgi:hypothetical protein
VFALAALFMLLPAGAGGYLAWQNRHAIVHARVGEWTWTGHLWGVLVIGALLACWFMLGAAFLQCRFAERRRARSMEPDAKSPRRRAGRRARVLVSH